MKNAAFMQGAIELDFGLLLRFIEFKRSLMSARHLSEIRRFLEDCRQLVLQVDAQSLERMQTLKDARRRDLLI